MAQEGHDFFGLLYIGAILTKDGPKVIEFNARFSILKQQLLTRLESDLMQLIIDLENCQPIHFNWKDEAVVGVMLASKGYPGSYEKGHEISGFNLDSHYYVSGLKKEGQCFVNSGGRVILAIGKVQQLKKTSKCI